ncbi:MAG: sulfate adenylyltransferase subunit 1 [Actinomycetota bacterium]
MELLRFATAGSVDDGKSTLIGRLLFDSKQIFEDQWSAVEQVSIDRGEGYTNLALLTDGLRAEREQGITIDVAYRYFATPKRKFIIADTPGHVQYTRNMVTGASTADLALILVDARKGIQEQSRRHAILATLLRVPFLVLCVNKMDLVEYREEVFDSIREEFKQFAANLDTGDIGFIPISALNGDNVVSRSENMPWYQGQSLLDLLESVHVAPDWELSDGRFPVQYVIRPMTQEHHDYRGYAGMVAGGVFRPGEEVLVLPSGRRTRIRSIDTMDGPLAEAFPHMSVTMQLEQDIDVSRGSMIVSAAHPPEAGQDVEAMVCWMSEARPVRPGDRFTIKHTTQSVRAIIKEISYRLDVNTLEHHGVDRLELNELGRVRLRATVPLSFDRYGRNRRTGSFILIDEATNATAGAGMILGAAET